jgi:hypothetical protein
MLQFKNRTPYKGTITLFPDADGIDTLFAIVKGTFQLDAHLTIADEQVPVAVEPKYHGEPATSSLAMASDLSLMKPSTDVLVLGNARAPRGHAVRTMDVGVSVGPVRQVARIVGDRVWESDGISYRATTPEPFETMPLIWERAFGGRDATDKGPREDSRNPAGAGFRASDGQTPVEGAALPNIENPRDPVSSWKHHPAPVCFAPIAANWEPRRSYAGTYDEQWQKERAPYLPTDFDPRFLQIAPAALVTPSPLQGGEPVELVGFDPDGPMRFALPLPTARPRILFRLNDKPEEREAMLDTIIIEPTARRVQLVWRAAFACDKKALKVREVEATLAGRA